MKNFEDISKEEKNAFVKTYLNASMSYLNNIFPASMNDTFRIKPSGSTEYIKGPDMFRIKEIE